MLGKEIDREKKEALLSRLVVRLEGRINRLFVESVPLSCRVLGVHFEEISMDWYGCDESVFVYFENNEIMVIAPWSEVFEFFSNREPWEDYDACIFNSNIDRCIAITHNDEVKLIDLGG